MKLDPTVLLKKLVDQTGLMGREVVENDVNLPIGRALSDDLFEEGNEVLAGMASCRESGSWCNNAEGAWFMPRIFPLA